MGQFLDRVKGRKQVVLLSEGFDASLVHGREALSSEDSQAESSASVEGEIWRIDNDKRFGGTAVGSALQRMSEIFERGDVVLHAIDIRGLRTDSDASSTRSPSSNGALHLLADASHGEVFDNVNDLSMSFGRMLRQQETSYVIGFQKSSGKPGAFHRLSVKVKNAPGARVKHRKGYVDATDGDSPTQEMLAVNELMMSDLPIRDIAIEMLVASFPTITRPHVPVIVEISGPMLLRDVPGGLATGELLIYCFDQSGKVRDFLHQSITLDLTKVRSRLSRGIKYYATLSLPPGKYRLKAFFQVQESRRAGFTITAVEVPNFEKGPTLGPFFVEQDESWLMIKGPAKSKEIGYPFAVGAESFTPDASPILRRGSLHRFGLFRYQSSVEDRFFSPRVTDLNGNPVEAAVALVRSSRDKAAGELEQLYELNVAALVPGSYLLKVGGENEGTLPFGTSFVVAE